jgi:hypothetical protein
MQARAQHVHRRLEQVIGDQRGEEPDAAVGREHAPVAVDDQRRVRLVRGQ